MILYPVCVNTLHYDVVPCPNFSVLRKSRADMLSNICERLYPMQIKCKKLSPTAIIPTKAHQTDAGWDLYSDEDVSVFANSRKLIQTNIAVQIPSGYVGLIWPRSGLSYKKGIDVLGGVIDSSYRDSVGVILYNTGDEDLVVKKGDRIAQILFQEVPHFNLIEVDSLNDSDRGVNGFGSSGS